MTSTSMTGKTIIVTGGASGIGQAATILLAKERCNIVIADRDRSRAEDIVKQIDRIGSKALFVETDVASEDSVRDMVTACRAHFGRVDGAINSAGIPQTGKAIHEVTSAEWDACHAVNLRGMFLSVKYQALAMLETGGGAIVAIASTSAVTATPNAAEYSASKAGVCGFVRGVALDYVRRGIRINAVLPGGTWTPMAERALGNDPALDTIVNAIPMQRWAKPEEVAAGALWLLSDHASYVTGASLVIDGAMTII